MFREDLCNQCGKCLSQCQWMDIDNEKAIEHIKRLINKEHTSVLDNCITCYACNDSCPENAYPFELIASLQERYHTLYPKGKLDAIEKRFSTTEEVVHPPRANRIISLCIFEESNPELIKGELYDLPQVGGKPYFCWVLFSHLGGVSIQKNHVKALIQNLMLSNPKEVVCFHDDCYTMLAHLAPAYGFDVPFRPIHLAEHLVQHLKKKQLSLNYLDLKIAYQTPCTSRYTPEKEKFIDELFELVGVERVVREYDRKNAMCCAGVKNMLEMDDPAPYQEKNIMDAVNAGAQALVCLCPMCMKFLVNVAGRHNLPIIFIGDLARMALGEININDLLEER